METIYIKEIKKDTYVTSINLIKVYIMRWSKFGVLLEGVVGGSVADFY